MPVVITVTYRFQCQHFSCKHFCCQLFYGQHSTAHSSSASTSTTSTSTAIPSIAIPSTAIHSTAGTSTASTSAAGTSAGSPTHSASRYPVSPLSWFCRGLGRVRICHIPQRCCCCCCCSSFLLWSLFSNCRSSWARSGRVGKWARENCYGVLRPLVMLSQRVCPVLVQVSSCPTPR